MVYVLSNKGYIEIASYESVSTQKYLDTSGVETIGIGSTRSDIIDLHLWSWSKVITLQQAFDYFKNTMAPYVKAVNKFIKVPLSQHQFDALVSIAYNIGCSGEAHSSFLRDINEKASQSTIDNAIRVWNESGGKRSQGLENRRNKEIKLFDSGVYSNDGMILHFPVDPKTHYPLYHQGKNINANDYFVG